MIAVISAAASTSSSCTGTISMAPSSRTARLSGCTDERDGAALKRVGRQRAEHGAQRVVVQRVCRTRVVELIGEVGELDEARRVAQRRATNHRPDLDRDGCGLGPVCCRRRIPTRDWRSTAATVPVPLRKRALPGAAVTSDTSVAVCGRLTDEPRPRRGGESAGVESPLSSRSPAAVSSRAGGSRSAATGADNPEHLAHQPALSGRVTCAISPARSRPRRSRAPAAFPPPHSSRAARRSCDR